MPASFPNKDNSFKKEGANFLFIMVAVTLKTSKTRMFSTVLDVVRRGRMIKTDTLNFVPEDDPTYDYPIIDDGEIEAYIHHADGIVLSYLTQRYGGEAGLRTTPWITTPYRYPKNANKSKLISVQLNEVEDIYDNDETLKEKITEMTGYDIRRLKVTKIDMTRKVAFITIYYKS